MFGTKPRRKVRTGAARDNAEIGEHKTHGLVTSKAPACPDRKRELMWREENPAREIA